MSFLNFLLLRHHKLQGHVYVACEQIKYNGKTCLFAGHWFSDKTFSADGNKFAADFEVFVLLTLEKITKFRVVVLGPRPITVA